MGGKRRKYKEHKSGDDEFRFRKQVPNINLLSLLRSYGVSALFQP